MRQGGGGGKLRYSRGLPGGNTGMFIPECQDRHTA